MFNKDKKPAPTEQSANKKQDSNEKQAANLPANKDQKEDEKAVSGNK